MSSRWLQVALAVVFFCCFPNAKTEKTAWDNIRLVGANSHYRGRVEVKKDGVWGTICDDDWSLYDGAVACRQLGFDGVVRTWAGGYFGEGSGPIHYDDMDCRNTEETLDECSGRLGSDCTHAEDAAVECVQPKTQVSDAECRDNQFLCKRDNKCIPARWTCDGDNDCGDESDEADTLCSSLLTAKNYTLRLAGGRTAYEGRVEIMYDNEWGTICDDNWSLEDARVVCKELGFKNAKSALPNAYFGQADAGHHIWVDELRCVGIEQRLGDCPRNPWGSHDCSHHEDAGVFCVPNEGVTGDAPTPTFRTQKDCGVSEIPVSVDTDARKGSWPWQTSLRLLFRNGLSRHICSATLVSRQWAVTAAHCIPEEMRNNANWKLRTGEHNQNVYESTEQDHQIQSIIIHPQFKDDEPQEHDIAMLKLTRPISFREDSHVNSVCISEDISIKKQDICFVTGWEMDGETTRGDNTLHQHKVRVANTTECGARPGTIGAQNFICASRSTDECNLNDGGGSLVCIRNSRWNLLGVVPVGKKCEEIKRPALYTRLSTYMEWVKHVMAN